MAIFFLKKSSFYNSFLWGFLSWHHLNHGWLFNCKTMLDFSTCLILFFPPNNLILTYFPRSGTAHCANMYPARSEDLPQLTLARDHIFLLLQQWLKQWLTDETFWQIETFELTTAFMTARWTLENKILFRKMFYFSYKSHFLPNHWLSKDVKMQNSWTFLVIVKGRPSFLSSHYFPLPFIYAFLLLVVFQLRSMDFQALKKSSWWHKGR